MNHFLISVHACSTVPGKSKGFRSRPLQEMLHHQPQGWDCYQIDHLTLTLGTVDVTGMVLLRPFQEGHLPQPSDDAALSHSLSPAHVLCFNVPSRTVTTLLISCTSCYHQAVWFWKCTILNSVLPSAIQVISITYTYKYVFCMCVCVYIYA